ncbi:hypothetical protein KFL_004370080 [Klebsormidium nitens]|uniref:Transmembrane protein n=1 Tax=Klebsormidium nitens TaxID=105231 RepID=A0A1Y1IK91_KLENI|nr:hypothetical protein KFL_004370080 [Klebsormidium nitens]|eukprot:GAQ88538.1 hypothetical protein KFL_004370080 [Klebsormidium nitens]
METLRSRSGKEGSRREDPYERLITGGVNAHSGTLGGDNGKRKRTLRRRLKDDQIDMRYFWAFLGLLAVAVFTFAYVNAGHPELQAAEGSSDLDSSATHRSTAAGVKWASLSRLRARRAGFWPFVSGTGDEDLDELGDLITQMEEANKGYRVTSSQLYSEESPLEEAEGPDGRTNFGMGGKEKRTEAGGAETVRKFGTKGDAVGGRNGDEKKDGSVSSAGLFSGRKIASAAERAVKTEPLRDVTAKIESSQYGEEDRAVESRDMETNDEGVASDLRIRGSGRNPNGRALAGGRKKPRTQNEAHARNFWTSRNMLAHEIKDHVTYDDVAGRGKGLNGEPTAGGRNVLSTREDASKFGDVNANVEEVQRPESAVPPKTDSVDSSEQLEAAVEPRSLRAALAELHRAVASFGNGFGLPVEEADQLSNPAQPESLLAGNDFETRPRDVFSQIRTALNRNGETILVAPMRVASEEGLGGLELASPSDVAAAAAKMPPRVLHDAPRPRPVKNHAKTQTRTFSWTPPAVVDRESLFEEGSGGLHALRNPAESTEGIPLAAEKESGESAEGASAVGETAEDRSGTESVGTAAEETRAEEERTGVDGPVTEAERTAAEAERSVEERFAKARAVRDAARARGASSA